MNGQPTLLKNVFLFSCMCVYTYHVCAAGHRGQKKGPKLASQAAVSHSGWVRGTKCRFSGRTANKFPQLLSHLSSHWYPTLTDFKTYKKKMKLKISQTLSFNINVKGGCWRRIGNYEEKFRGYVKTIGNSWGIYLFSTSRPHLPLFDLSSSSPTRTKVGIKGKGCWPVWE